MRVFLWVLYSIYVGTFGFIILVDIVRDSSCISQELKDKLWTVLTTLSHVGGNGPEVAVILVEFLFLTVIRVCFKIVICIKNPRLICL